MTLEHEPAPVTSRWNPFVAVDDPYPIYESLRSADAVHYDEEHELFALSRYKDVQAASRDWRTFSSAGGVDLDQTGAMLWGAGNILDLDPPRHDALRHVVRNHFTPHAVRQLADMVAAEVDALIDGFSDVGRVDAVRDFSWALTIRVGCHVLGLPRHDVAELSHLFERAISREPGRSDVPPDALRAGVTIREYIVELVEARRRDPRGDLVSELGTATVDGQALQEEAVGLAFILFAASIETASSLISNAIQLLRHHPQLRRRLVCNGELLVAAIEECLRFEAPVQFNARTTTRDVEIDGVRLPRGARVALLYGSANRDERRWPSPRRFDVDRASKRHLAFGEGIHFCLGAPIARLEARVALQRFWSRIPEYRLVGPGVRLTKGNLRGFSSLPLEFDRSRAGSGGRGDQAM